MDLSRTHRLALPLLHAGQAQKEIFHNEALAALDFMVQPVVQSIDDSAPPQTPVPGQCHIVGADATGAWAGAASKLACWTPGGWRFAEPFEGMSIWWIGNGPVRFEGGEWRVGVVTARKLVIEDQQVVGAQGEAVALAQGGTVIDVEARTAIAAIVDRLASHGLIAEP